MPTKTDPKQAESSFSTLADEDGSTTLEAMGAVFILSILVTAGLMVSYCSFARVWSDRCAYEAAVCLASTEEVNTCNRNLRNALTLALPIGKSDHLQLHRSLSEARIDFQFEITSGLRLQIQERLPLPLHAQAGFGGIL